MKFKFNHETNCRSLNSSLATTYSIHNPARNTAKTMTTSLKSSNFSVHSPSPSASRESGAKKYSIAKATSATYIAFDTGHCRMSYEKSTTFPRKRVKPSQTFSSQCWSWCRKGEQTPAEWRAINTWMARRGWKVSRWEYPSGVEGKVLRGGHQRLRGGRGAAFVPFLFSLNPPFPPCPVCWSFRPFL